MTEHVCLKKSSRGLCAQGPWQAFRTWLNMVQGTVSHWICFSGTTAAVWKGSSEERAEQCPAVTTEQSPELCAKNKVWRCRLRQVEEGWWNPGGKAMKRQKNKPRLHADGASGQVYFINRPTSPPPAKTNCPYQYLATLLVSNPHSGDSKLHIGNVLLNGMC